MFTEVIIDTAALGTAVMVGWVSKYLLSKRNKKLPPNIYPFVSVQKYSCPQCDIKWNDNNFKYCECDEFYLGHFHLFCDGHTPKNGESLGCQYKWIMLAKQSKL